MSEAICGFNTNNATQDAYYYTRNVDTCVFLIEMDTTPRLTRRISNKVAVIFLWRKHDLMVPHEMGFIGPVQLVHTTGFLHNSMASAISSGLLN